MLRIKVEIRKREQKKDGSFNVKIRFTLNRQIKRVSSDINVYAKDLNRDFSIKNNCDAFDKVNLLIASYREKYREISSKRQDYTLDTLIDLIVNNRSQEEVIDFIAFSKRWIENTDIKGKKNYKTAINSFTAFLGKDSLNIKDLTSKLLKQYTSYLNAQRQERIEKLQRENKRIPSYRALSLNLGSIRHLYKEAQKEYNDYECNIIPIPHSPFEWFTVPKQEVTRKRALPVEKIIEIYKLPYRKDNRSARQNIYNLSKDCFILSFCLMGMNSADLYHAFEYDGMYIKYNRMKTKDRRADRARMEVRILDIVKPIVQKYLDPDKEKVFDFYKRYTNESIFNQMINKGLKEIGNELGIDDLEFYAARHSWATIALNKAGVDKYTVHSALNHVDSSMSVTDIYIEKDFSVENEANRKVMEYVFKDIALKCSSDNLNGNVNHCLMFWSIIKFAV